MITEGEIRNINFYVNIKDALPKLGDAVNATLTDCEVSGFVLAYNHLEWTEQGQLKLTCKVKVEQVFYLKTAGQSSKYLN